MKALLIGLTLLASLSSFGEVKNHKFEICDITDSGRIGARMEVSLDTQEKRMTIKIMEEYSLNADGSMQVNNKFEVDSHTIDLKEIRVANKNDKEEYFVKNGRDLILLGEDGTPYVIKKSLVRRKAIALIGELREIGFTSVCKEIKRALK